MAWREFGKKGIHVSLSRILTSRASRTTAVRNSFSGVESKSLSASVGCIREYTNNSAYLGDGTLSFLTSKFLLRHFHASPELLGRRGNDTVGLQTPKKGKFKKRPENAKPPVETPYVPPKLKKTAKSSSDRTIEIFEGMTTLELAKRCGQYVATLQNILVNVGEKVGSEFDPLGIDIAELIAMPLHSFGFWIRGLFGLVVLFLLWVQNYDIR